MPEQPKRQLSKREVQAIAYGLADEIETRARALMAKEPEIDRATAVIRTVLAMGAKA